MKTIASLNLGVNYTNNKMYNIINTDDYCGDMGVIVVECFDTHALIDYGFSDNECDEIDNLSVGELFTSHDYGSGCVIVRMK